MKEFKEEDLNEFKSEVSDEEDYLRAMGRTSNMQRMLCKL